MARFALDITTAHSVAKTVEAWGAIAGELIEAEVLWRGPEIEPAPDPTYPPRAGLARWTHPDATLEVRHTARLVSRRDGFIYDVVVRMEVGAPGGAVEVKASCSSWEGDVQAHTLWFSGGLSGADFERVRGVVVAELGRGSNRHGADGVTWARNIREVLESDPELAERWLAMVVPAKPHPGHSGIRELLRCRAHLLGNDPDLLRDRLRASPEDIHAWRLAAQSPPAGYEHRIGEILVRLEPYDSDRVSPPFDLPDPSGWQRVLPGGEFDKQGLYGLDEVIFPGLRRLPADEETDNHQGVTLRTVRSVRFGRRRLPEVHVIRSVVAEGGHRPLRQWWFWGPRGRDCLRVVSEWEPGVEFYSPRPVAVWIHVAGGRHWRDRIEHALAESLPYPRAPEPPQL